MIQIGDEVVIMSSPGRFRVIALEGLVVTIENSVGIRKLVLETSLRTLEKPTVG